MALKPQKARQMSADLVLAVPYLGAMALKHLILAL